MTHPFDIALQAKARSGSCAASTEPSGGASVYGEPDEERSAAPASIVEITIPADHADDRLDKALAATAPALAGLSRTRIARLLEEGRVLGPTGARVSEGRRRVKPGERYRILCPPAAPAEPGPEAIPLAVLHEDADLIVIDKPAGMVVHPAPGSESGTLVNALLAHCGPSLTGIGGERRPGIVHRLDKDTSGVMVAAKTAAAHEGLARQFAAHRIERRYLALLRGVPEAADPRLSGLSAVSFEAGGWIRIDAPLGRHPTDRKRMSVRPGAGRRAVTRLRVLERFGDCAASLVECRLETGRTHQIRVHAAHVGHALIGDPVYGRGAAPRVPGADGALAAFPRQALHAAQLGFAHPSTGAQLAFETPPPADFADLLETLRRNRHAIR